MRDTAAGWGPERRRAAVSLSFDNLGEAADLGRGIAIPPAQLGRHPTATEFFPRLLELVRGLHCTWFIEAANTLWYPQVIRDWVAAGHEAGIHAWQHEKWGTLDAATRRELLARSVDAFGALGLRPTGFRPPGGALPTQAVQEFRDAGLRYASPLEIGQGTQVVDGFALLPFAWHHVDAYMLDPDLPALRQRHGDPERACSIDEWDAVLQDALADTCRRGEHLTVIFHPVTLLAIPGSVAALQRFIERLRHADDAWVAPCGAVADWLLATD